MELKSLVRPSGMTDLVLAMASGLASLGIWCNMAFDRYH